MHGLVPRDHYPCTVTVIYHIRRKPHPGGEREKTAVALLCAGVDVLSWSSPMEEKKVSVCLLYVCCCKLLEGRKGRPADFPRPIPWFSRTSSLSPVVLLCFLRGWESIPFSAEGRPAELHTHFALTAPAREPQSFASRRGASVCARARVRTAPHARTHT